MYTSLDNPVALYNVGVGYFSGKGAPEQSFEKAAKYFEKASILGFYPAQVGGLCGWSNHWLGRI